MKKNVLLFLALLITFSSFSALESELCTLTSMYPNFTSSDHCWLKADFDPKSSDSKCEIKLETNFSQITNYKKTM